ncbi:hypothetical protein ACH4T9_29875 [Micromonospora sp. NPDC020750]|uniref:hypothetical protein n=1 Tax=unclassified Micromonospora TaxID=2617518 RepID=UPI0037A9EACB
MRIGEVALPTGPAGTDAEGSRPAYGTGWARRRCAPWSGASVATGRDGDLAAVLAALDNLSARHWDFRGGRERPDAREPALDPATATLVVATAAALGMVRPAEPAQPGYAHLVVLGGLAHACQRRVTYAAGLRYLQEIRSMRAPHEVQG